MKTTHKNQIGLMQGILNSINASAMALTPIFYTQVYGSMKLFYDAYTATFAVSLVSLTLLIIATFSLKKVQKQSL